MRCFFHTREWGLLSNEFILTRRHHQNRLLVFIVIRPSYRLKRFKSLHFWKRLITVWGLGQYSLKLKRSCFRLFLLILLITMIILLFWLFYVEKLTFIQWLYFLYNIFLLRLLETLGWRLGSTLGCSIVNKIICHIPIWSRAFIHWSFLHFLHRILCPIYSIFFKWNVYNYLK